MGTPQCNYHKKIDKWRLFEEDVKEFEANRDKYSGILTMPETYVFVYRVKGRQIKSCQRLADVYEFKLQWESQNES